MVDYLPAVDTDGGKQEALPVVIFGPDGTPAGSASPTFVKAANYVPRGDQQITIATLQSVTALTVPGSATVAFMQNNTNQAIRWRDTPAGTNPTTSVGQRILAGDTLTYDGALANWEGIAEAAGTGTLDIVYYS